MHFLSGLQWKCVDTGRLSRLDHLSLMYTVGQFLLSISLLVDWMWRQFRRQLRRICAWRRDLGILCTSSPLHVSLLCRLLLLLLLIIIIIIIIIINIIIICILLLLLVVVVLLLLLLLVLLVLILSNVCPICHRLRCNYV